MVILHVMSVWEPKGNGVAMAVKDYLKYESIDNEVALFSLNTPLNLNDVNEYDFSKFKNIKDLPGAFSSPDLVVFNEVYKPKYIALYKECLKRKIKYIIIPHGCLVHEAQKRHKLKKIIGNYLLFNRFIYKANAIQFLNQSEKNNSKFKYKKYIIAGNGVNQSLYRNTSNNKNKDLIFIGRYELKHKGLDLLTNVCNENHEWFINNKIKIQLYGRDSGNDLIKLKKIIYKYKVDDVLIVNGPVYGEEKIEILKKAYAFIQCSRFEGQPMGIIEALSFGVPCVVTYGTYLGDYIEGKKCGIACNFNSNEVFNAICKIVNNSNYRDQLSNNAYKKSNDDFNWQNVIDDTLNEYKKI